MIQQIKLPKPPAQYMHSPIIAMTTNPINASNDVSSNL